MGLTERAFDALGLSWLDKLSAERAAEWASLKARVTALLDDLERVSLGLIPLSVPDAEPRRVIAWGDTEKLNLDRFGDNVLLAQSELGILDGLRLRWDLSSVKGSITLAQSKALNTLAGDVTGQEIDPELAELGTPPPEVDLTPYVVLAGVLLAMGFLVVARG